MFKEARPAVILGLFAASVWGDQRNWIQTDRSKFLNFAVMTVEPLRDE